MTERAGSSGPADAEKAKLKAILRRNMPTGVEADLGPTFDNIVWEVWISPGSGNDSRRLDETVFLAMNDLKIQADKIYKMPEFQKQASEKSKQILKSLLSLYSIPNIRHDLVGRPRNDRARNVADILKFHYKTLYQERPSQFEYGDFVSILGQIFAVMGIKASATDTARTCLALVKSSPKKR